MDITGSTGAFPGRTDEVIGSTGEVAGSPGECFESPGECFESTGEGPERIDTGKRSGSVRGRLEADSLGEVSSGGGGETSPTFGGTGERSIKSGEGRDEPRLK